MAELKLHRKRQHLPVRWTTDDEWLRPNELGDLGARPLHVHPGHAGPIPTSRPGEILTTLGFPTL